jgi:hypothetical protein
MTASAYTRLTEDEYLFHLRREIDALKGRAEYPRYAHPEKQRAEIIAHFLRRAIQLGEAAYRVRNLSVALEIFVRVLCDDLIRLFWVSQSESNAAEYAKVPLSEMVKLARVNLEKGHARVINKKTGEDTTKKVLAKASSFISKAKPIEQLAKQCGLEKVYDMPFRISSLVLHANTFGLPEPPGDSDLVALPAIIGFIKAVSAIADGYPDRPASAEHVLRILKLYEIGRKP